MNTMNILKDDPTVNIKVSDQRDDGEAWLKRRNSKAFYQALVAPTVRQGTIGLLQVGCCPMEISRI
jgi:hypothetical protein